MADLGVAMDAMPRLGSRAECLALASKIKRLFAAAWTAHPPHLISSLSPIAAKDGQAHRDSWRHLINRLVHLFVALGQADAAGHCYMLAVSYRLYLSVGALRCFTTVLASQGYTGVVCRVLSHAMEHHPASRRLEEVVSSALHAALTHQGQHSGSAMLPLLYDLMMLWVLRYRNGVAPSPHALELVAAIANSRHAGLARRFQSDLTTGKWVCPVDAAGWRALTCLAYS